MTTQQTATGGHPTLVDIPIGVIQPSPTNPRRFFDVEALNELTESVRLKGVLEPILVRPAAGTKKAAGYELIAGERRWRASKQAELKTIPAIIRQMTDEEVLDAQIHENLHRADIHPMDEAFGYQHLLNVVEGLSVEELARRVGKSPKYVAQRLSLVSLIEPAVNDFMAGLISLGHAQQIARLAPEVQQQALDNCFEQNQHWNSKEEKWEYTPDKEGGAITVNDLNAWISQNLALDLTKAPWSLEDSELVPAQGPCSTCQFNTATNQLLFGDSAQSAICTNPEGYERKMQAWVTRQIEKLKTADQPEVLLLTQIWQIDKNDVKRWNLPPGALGRDSFTAIEKKKDRCEFSKPAVFIQGHQRGQTAWACTELKCKDHKGRIRSTSTSGSTGERTEKSQSEKDKMYRRKQELFDARVAEPVRRRTLKVMLERISPFPVLLDSKTLGMWPLERSYFERMAYEHFLRIPTDTQRVMFEVLDWPDVAKLDNFSFNKKKQRDTRVGELIEKMSDTELLRFHFLCAVAHHGENINIYGAVDQSVILKLAEKHAVPYKLFDARARVEMNPAKKFSGLHSRHLLEVLLGHDVKRPVLYSSKTAVIDSGADYYDLKKLVEETITPTPFLDGPEGVSLVGARVRVIGGKHKGATGELLETGNWQGGIQSKVKLDDGGEAEILCTQLVYVEGMEAELAKRRTPAKSQKKAAGKSAPAKKSGAKKAPGKVAGKKKQQKSARK